MKYGKEEALKEILRRSEQITVQRDLKLTRALSAAACALFAALIAVIALLPSHGAALPAGSVYGAFLLSAEAGGYVLAAVIAFALGVLVTLLSQRRRRSGSQKPYAKEGDKE